MSQMYKDRFITIGSCSLSQTALDFEGNYERIYSSILSCVRQGCEIRTGAELEICGYSCEDHFFETDTYTHSWEVIEKLLLSKVSDQIVCDIGMPLMYQNKRYNCRIILWRGKILGIRAKKVLASNGNYRESRWFSPWPFHLAVIFTLPSILVKCTQGQKTALFGDIFISFKDVSLGFEICEELYIGDTVFDSYGLLALNHHVEIILNGSASYHSQEKLHYRVSTIERKNKKYGGVYVYSNTKGCDGSSVYFDGGSMIFMNGKLLSQALQFDLRSEEVIIASVNLKDVFLFRFEGCYKTKKKFHSRQNYTRIHVNEFLCKKYIHPRQLSIPKPVLKFSIEEEMSLGPASWLWDYLRKSNASGFFLPLSGGLDSCSVALIVYSMCETLYKYSLESIELMNELNRVLKRTDDYRPSSAKDICKQLLHTSYMSSRNSEMESKRRAEQLALLLNTNHMSVSIESIIESYESFIKETFHFTPDYKTHSSSLILQNLQARTRMSFAYLMSQCISYKQGTHDSLLVLGSANADESLRGYFTKYDCSSADISPIGSFSKNNLRAFVAFMRDKHHFFILDEFLQAIPSAELLPVQQSDEVEMKMTYDDLEVFGNLRSIERCGPVSMFHKCKEILPISTNKIAQKVKDFFYYYGKNRHKMTSLTPSYHGKATSPDDRRFDQRPFCYPNWSWQFRKIDDKKKEQNVNKGKTYGKHKRKKLNE